MKNWEKCNDDILKFAQAGMENWTIDAGCCPKKKREWFDAEYEEFWRP